MRTSGQAEADLIAAMSDARRAVDEREVATANRNSAILAAYNAKVKVKDLKGDRTVATGSHHARLDAVTDTCEPKSNDTCPLILRRVGVVAFVR